MKVVVRSHLAVPPDIAFFSLRMSRTLVFVAQPVVSYHAAGDLPPVWRLGETYNLRPCLRGRSQGDHYVTFTRIDDVALEMETSEHGGYIKRWDHHMSMRQAPDGGTIYTDTIEIEAGWRTWFVCLFAKRFYQHRHRRWQELVTKFNTAKS